MTKGLIWAQAIRDTRAVWTGSLIFSLVALGVSATTSYFIGPPILRLIGTPEWVSGTDGERALVTVIGPLLLFLLLFLLTLIVAPYRVAHQTIRTMGAEIERLRLLTDRGDPMSRLRSAASGSADVDPADVRSIPEQKVPELMGVMLASESNVKKRQTAVVLAELGHLHGALELMFGVTNRTEGLKVILAVIKRMTPVTPAAAREWRFLESSVQYLEGPLREPQRRHVVEALAAKGITPLGSWAEIARSQRAAEDGT